jgi:hypothetical protein
MHSVLCEVQPDIGLYIYVVELFSFSKTRAGACEICGKESGTGKAFSSRTWLFSCQAFPTNSPYSFHLHVALTRRTNQRRLEAFNSNTVYVGNRKRASRNLPSIFPLRRSELLVGVPSRGNST